MLGEEHVMRQEAGKTPLRPLWVLWWERQESHENCTDLEVTLPRGITASPPLPLVASTASRGLRLYTEIFQTTAAFRPEMFVIKKEIVKSFPAWYIPRLPPAHHLSWISSAKQT